MMTSTATAKAVICLTGFLGLQQQGAITTVEGHAFMMAPVSRTFFYTPVFQDPGFENMEYCPHCMQSKGPAAVRARAEANTDPVELELYGGGRWPHFDAFQRGELASNGNYYETDAIAVRHGVCGDPGQTKPEGDNLYGQDNSIYPVLETFAEGSVIEMKVVFSTYHWGHLEFFICNAEDLVNGPDSSVTQGCFNMHPLDRADDDGDASPIDPNHPGRYYVDPVCREAETDQTKPAGTESGHVVTARYQLPDGLTCDRCTVQMVYYTGNSCSHPGYEEFNPTSWPSACAPTKADWITLDPGMCGEGDKYPEEFWNCADIEITADGGSSPRPAPTTSSSESVADPTPAPVGDSTPAPVDNSTPAPVDDSTPTPVDDSTPAPVDDSTPAPVTEPEPITEPTPEPSYAEEPTYSSTTSEDPTPTPSPVEEETAEPFGGGAPTPTISDAPATFAPIAIDEEEACNGDDVIADYAQCGGTDYEGSACCGQGFFCEEMAECYSECRPSIESEDCSEGWGQCGGNLWEGPTCCGEGAECFERNEWYSQCVPAA